ncbi:cation diffusion facilitator family transporter [Falsibacillus albus]|uniref:Cation transporter n=1 Tax=Falsibacillus albus TaxID=2478915 RepID=A0A3L7K2V6_9BACI|nr:cation diffusion facilitator family transporter [Falsibacillus albus]RLQ97363.1 cation transporter [Falsibacillus albus]
MGHNHNHSHGHHHTNNKKVLFISFLLITSFMIIEAIGGWVTNSLALLSDAGHMLSDSASLGLSFFAMKLGERQSTDSKTYGYKRFEIIAALINGAALAMISLMIIYEAIHRFFNPPEVQSKGMLLIAIIGLIINIIVAWILMKGEKEENLNVKSAFLHVLGDLMGSVGAIVAAILIYFLNWGIADPIASVIVAILVLVSGYRVLKESLHILMEGAPSSIDVAEVRKALLAMDKVEDIHDLHVWSITSGFQSFSCHLVMEEEGVHEEVLKHAQNLLYSQFGIKHSTIQIEKSKGDCVLHPETCN